MTEVFCRYIRKNGKIIYPKKGKFFHFWVEDNEKDPVVEPNLIHVEEQGRKTILISVQLLALHGYILIILT